MLLSFTFGKKAELADDPIYVQRKTDGLIVYGLTAGDYAISVDALVKARLTNVAELTANDSEISIDADKSTTLEFKN